MAAVICDLDGLLVDSEELHFQAYRSMLEGYGVIITREEFIERWLSETPREQYGTRYYLGQKGITDEAEIQAARHKKSDLFCEMARGKLKFIPGAREFLTEVKARGLPCGVGTGCYKIEYELMAKECGLGEWVQVFVGGDEVAHNKPYPDIFLAVASRLGVSPEQCVVFENADVGVSAARNANMKCIVVPSAFSKDQDFSRAEKILDSLRKADLISIFPLEIQS